MSSNDSDLFCQLIGTYEDILMSKRHILQIDPTTIVFPKKFKAKKARRRTIKKSSSQYLVLTTKSLLRCPPLVVTSLDEFSEFINNPQTSSAIVRVISCQVSQQFYDEQLNGSGFKREKTLSFVLGALDSSVNVFSPGLFDICQRIVNSQRFLSDRIWNTRSELCYQKLPSWKLAIVLKSAPPLLLLPLNKILKDAAGCLTSEELYDFTHSMALRFIHNSLDDCTYTLNRIGSHIDYSLWTVNDLLFDRSPYDDRHHTQGAAFDFFGEHSWLFNSLEKPLSFQNCHISDLNFSPNCSADSLKGHALCLENNYRKLVICDVLMPDFGRQASGSGPSEKKKKEVQAFVVPVTDVRYEQYKLKSVPCHGDTTWKCLIELIRFVSVHSYPVNTFLVNMRNLLTSLKADIWKRRSDFHCNDHWKNLLLLSLAPDEMFDELCTLIEDLGNQKNIIVICRLLVEALQQFNEEQVLTAMNYIVPDVNKVVEILNKFLPYPPHELDNVRSQVEPDIDVSESEAFVLPRIISPILPDLCLDSQPCKNESDENGFSNSALNEVALSATNAKVDEQVVSNSKLITNSTPVAVKTEQYVTATSFRREQQLGSPIPSTSNAAHLNYGSCRPVKRKNNNLANTSSPQAAFRAGSAALHVKRDHELSDRVFLEPQESFSQNQNSPRVSVIKQEVSPEAPPPPTSDASPLSDRPRPVKRRNNNANECKTEVYETQPAATTDSIRVSLNCKALVIVCYELLQSASNFVVMWMAAVQEDILATMFSFPNKCVLITAEHFDESLIRMFNCTVIRCILRTESRGDLNVSVIYCGNDPLPFTADTLYTAQTFEAYTCALMSISQATRLVHIARSNEPYDTGFFPIVCKHFSREVIGTNCR